MALRNMLHGPDSQLLFLPCGFILFYYLIIAHLGLVPHLRHETLVVWWPMALLAMTFCGGCIKFLSRLKLLQLQ